ncbi:hypothetical protein [Acinetobacter radioresistens]|uniref:hypothetical protein n=1 Tax=Acinetobacter radioresistens TaxID=40216 RepID=UPI000C3264A5|nr:hypothetical protein [Acinetobacter radioresistens]PKH30521.1 hypothetical protein BJF94_09625 [Acinetobacter radioresistens]
MGLNSNYILADSDLLGSFGFEDYSVFLNVDDKSFLQHLHKEAELGDFEESLKYYSAAIHEYRHYFDMTHTTYGINYFYSLDQALRQRYKKNKGDELNFHKIKSFTNELKKIRYPSYYNHLWQEDNSKQWELRPTIGKVFDSYGYVSDRPVLFARYFNSQGEALSRHPFSMVSLLECSATIDEYINSMGLISSLSKNEGNYNFLIARFEKINLDYVYNINLTEYSTCFHLIANHFRITHLQKLFDIARILIDICLNFTERHFDLLNQSNIVDQLYKPSSLFSTEELEDYIYFNSSLKNGLKFLERPILFYVLLHLMEKKEYHNKQEVISELNRILSLCGLTCRDVMMDSKALIKDKARLVSSSQINYFSKIAQTIAPNLDRISTFRDGEDGFNFLLKFIQHLDMPCIEMYSGFEVLMKRDNNPLEDIDYSKEIENIKLLRNWVNDYDNACIF